MALKKDDGPTITVVGNDGIGQVLSGVMDVLTAICCVMANSGMIERSDIAEAMAAVLAQQDARDGGATEATQFAAAALKKFFSRQVVGGAVN
jgi:hypothetical protein